MAFHACWGVLGFDSVQIGSNGGVACLKLIVTLRLALGDKAIKNTAGRLLIKKYADISLIYI